MTDQPHYPGAPRWAKVFALIFAAVALLFFVMLFTRGPNRGHGVHTSSVDAIDLTRLAGATDVRGSPAVGSR